MPYSSAPRRKVRNSPPIAVDWAVAWRAVSCGAIWRASVTLFMAGAFSVCTSMGHLAFYRSLAAKVKHHRGGRVHSARAAQNDSQSSVPVLAGAADTGRAVAAGAGVNAGRMMLVARFGPRRSVACAGLAALPALLMARMWLAAA